MKKKLLVVEDQSEIRQLLRMTLEDEDIEILECADAATGEYRDMNQEPRGESPRAFSWLALALGRLSASLRRRASRGGNAASGTGS